MMDRSKSKSRWQLRFSVQTLMYLTLLVGVFLGTYLPLTAKLGESVTRNRQLQTRIDDLNLKIRHLEASNQVKKAQYDRRIEYLEEVLRGRGYAGRGTYFLHPPPQER